MPLLGAGRVVLPNWKTYAAVSIILLSTSFYYAAQAANNSSGNIFISTDLVFTKNTIEGFLPSASSKYPQNDTFTRQVKQAAKILVQDSFGVWSMINMAYCCILLLGAFIQKVLFGELRPSEQQHIKDKFWTFVFYKFIFVFGIINVQYVHEVIFWCAWFSILGFLNLLTQLGKDRFEYLTFSLPSSNWGLIRLLGLLAGVFVLTGFMLLISAIVGVFAGFNIFAFMAAENIVLNWEKRGPVTYYTELVLETCVLGLDFMHHLHMLLWSNMFLSIASLVVSMQLRQLFYEIRKRIKRHQKYLWVARHLEENYPMVSGLLALDDNCAICWEGMNRARKLPCGHMFHNSCLQSWLEQDSSCPTCRTSLNNGIRNFGVTSTIMDEGIDQNFDISASGRSPYHFFHFDGSRYISWLPSFSVEVAHYQVDAPPPIQTHQIDSIAAEVQQLFPSIPLRLIAEDLRMSRSIEITIENILESRLSASRVENDYNDENFSEVISELNFNFQEDSEREANLGNGTQFPQLLESSVSPIDSEVEDDGSSISNENLLFSSFYTSEDDNIEESGAKEYLSSSTSISTSTSTSSSASKSSSNFFDSSTERESIFQKKKEELMLRARRKYIRKVQSKAQNDFNDNFNRLNFSQ